jgi:nucleoside-diphosphate-sugar epimerase
MRLLEADKHLLNHRVYNIHGIDFTPDEIAKELRKRFPDFIYKYEPDFRDLIAKNWPVSLNDNLARKDWGWNPKYTNIEVLVNKVLETIKETKHYDF